MNINATHATDRFVGVCDHCDRPIAVEDTTVQGDFLRTVCPECSTSVKLERLWGTLVTDIACHGACQGATGPQCDCSCGGENHGAGFVVGRGFDTESNIAKFRASRAKRAATVAAKKEAKAQAVRDAQASWLTDHPEVVAWLTAYQGNSDFFCSLAEQLARKGALSDKQVGAVERAIRGDAALAARKAEEAKTAKPAPAGRVEVTGQVASTRTQDGEFGITHKMLVKADGFKVWVTIPRDLIWAGEIGGDVEALKGHTVSFTATLEPSRDDASFCFGKRPSNARLVEGVSA